MARRLKKSLYATEQEAHKLFHNVGYRIGKTIGKGTFSKVCIAINNKRQKVACKIIDKSRAGEDFITRFLPREMNILTSISHPNIVSVHKIIEAGEVIYMFMDYCRNGDLLEFIRHNGFFSEDKAKYYFKQIIDAVYYLHNRDISHRDLKCENIFLMWNNQLKLGDFGFARKCKDELGQTILSETFCGSAAYAAPEILQGIPYNPKMYDIWALGCILYIMITATMPYDDMNIKKVLKDQLNRSVFTLTLLWTENSTALKKLVNALLEPDLLRRPTIKDVKKHAWLSNESSVSKMRRLLSLSDSSLF